MPQNFTTIFPYTRNEHLIKDLGQIPWFMQKQGYETSIATKKIDDSYSYLEEEVAGLKLHFLPDQGLKSFWEKSVIQFIKKHATQIDVLNLYHLTKETFIYGLAYKKANPNGILYLKMDAYNSHLDVEQTQYSGNTIKNVILKQYERRFLRFVDLITIENKTGLTLLKKLFPSIASKCFYLPNGVNDLNKETAFPTTRKWEQKENILLTVGRIGPKEKNMELLLNALPHLNLNGWKVVFAGPVANHFKEKVDAFNREHPELAQQVHFTGNIQDRKTLYAWYDRAKVFCLPSPFESFGLAFVEALSFGNYLVGSQGAAALQDLTNNFEYGSSFDVKNSEHFITTLQNALDQTTNWDATSEAAKAYAKEHFSWSEICGTLNQYIEDIKSNR